MAEYNPPKGEEHFTEEDHDKALLDLTGSADSTVPNRSAHILIAGSFLRTPDGLLKINPVTETKEDN
jgi:hypothetical protein